MADTECVLGLDLGTSGLKGTLLRYDGRVVATASAEYEFDSPHSGWAQIDAAKWELAARSVVGQLRQLAPDAQIEAVGIDGQMHGVLLVDERGEAIAPALLWPDTRAMAEVETWRTLAPHLKSALANPLGTGMAGPLLLWAAGHWPDQYRSAHRFLSPKDWLRTRLIPEVLVTDASDASATLLWDVVNNGWHRELAAELGIRASLFPEIRPSSSVAGRLDAATAASWSLPAGIPVSVGCGDVAATLTAINTGSATLSIIVGSGVQALVADITPTATAHPTFHSFRSATGSYFGMAAPLNGGLALKRVRDLLAMEWSEIYESPYLSIPNDEAVFLPYFAGERIPALTHASNAGWQGMGLSTSREMLAATAVEGMLFGLRRAIDQLPGHAGLIQMVGGGSKHHGIRQLAANVLGHPVAGRRIENATALGAALIAGKIAGWPAVVFDEDEALLSQPEPSTRIEGRFARFQEASDRVVAQASNEGMTR
ncbi:FGGY family carbohydrate kinase [Cryobacterium sp. Y82]|uniref:FGGY family carbohydrate kinase n=1 Tax=Cryobacterium sp. Y82 TaxID=2045017 RepID=UPI000CE3B374|nr:FGGY family carbohydrate kinase [Cryobacterium sp. Y82]